MQENVHKQKKEPLAQPTTPQDLSQSQDPIGQYMQPPWLGGIQGGKGWRMDGLAHKNSSGPWGAAGALRAHNPGAGAFGPRPWVGFAGPRARKTPPPPVHRREGALPCGSPRKLPVPAKPGRDTSGYLLWQA